MKNILPFFFLLISIGIFSNARAQICNANGNVVVFSNYDGGVLNIDVDVDIPNLKIGVVSYEAVTVNLSGTYVGNVVEVNYSGFNNAGGSCAPATTTINGAGSAVTSIDFAPAATYTDTDGYPMIICAYQCATGISNGGCNSATQITEFFANKFDDDIYFHQTQYGCWSGTQSLSAGGNCCLIPAMAPVAEFTVSSDEICINDCITFTDLSTNMPDAWNWSISGIVGPTIQNPVICFTFPGVFTIELEASNSTGSSTYSIPVTVHEVDNGITVSGFTLEADQSGATYQWLNCDDNYAQIPGETGSTFSPVNDGSYAASITLNGCTDTSACETISGLGLRDKQEQNTISVYPNPSNGMITVDASKSNWSGSVIRVTNVAGSVLSIIPISNAKTQVNLTDFAKGVYFVSVETQSGNTVQKITLE